VNEGASSDAASTNSTAATTATASPFRFIGGNPSAVEIAAVTAVLTGALEELSAEHERDSGVRQSAWQRSQRAIREPLRPGYGAWRSF